MKISKKDKAEIDLIELRQQALHGRSYGSVDMFIAQMLERFHTGEYPKTGIWETDPTDTEAYAVSLPWYLNHQISQAIIRNEPQLIHDLAKAVARIHGDGKRRKNRTQGQGPAFEITPVDPVLLYALETTIGGTVPISKAQFKQSLFESRGIRISDKKAQRILRQIGAPAAKGGRPRKDNLQDPKPDNAKRKGKTQMTRREIGTHALNYW